MIGEVERSALGSRLKNGLNALGAVRIVSNNSSNVDEELGQYFSYAALEAGLMKIDNALASCGISFFSDNKSVETPLYAYLLVNTMGADSYC